MLTSLGSSESPSSPLRTLRIVKKRCGFDDKVASFQAVTGLEDSDLCTEIISAHNWDLELAIPSFTSNGPSSSAPGLAWRIATLPFYVVSGAVGLGFWIAVGFSPAPSASSPRHAAPRPSA
ncbi:plant UBX domain-containing protein 10-like [Zingiber officinale]|uniref:plant UBX domain-containing protein 10-like n=1 Tax=Zingiber officinale TaxID=94328 RepID=UPI001C4B1BB0|nr:plant UBX domain-containing protein 10-like [Zingiber officinale]